MTSTQTSLMPSGGGRVLLYQNGGGVPLEPHGAHGERESIFEQFM